MTARVRCQQLPEEEARDRVCSQCGTTGTTGPKHTGRSQLSLWSALSRLSSLILCVCACLCTPAHSLFHNGQPSSMHHGRTLRSGRAPGAAVQGEGSSSLSRQLQQRSPRKDSTCPGLLGAQSSTQLLARRQAPGWSGSSAHAHRSGWGVTVVLLRPAILPVNPYEEGDRGIARREGTAGGTRVMRKNAGHLSHRNRKKSG